MDPQLVVHLLGPAGSLRGADPLTGPLQLTSGKFHDNGDAAQGLR